MMRGQAWYVAVLIGFMCAIRFGLGAYGYLEPAALMEQLGASLSANTQGPYIVRVWAIRDMVLAVLVVTAGPAFIKPLLAACIVIDTTDILSAYLAGASGMFSQADAGALTLTAAFALVPECIALLLILRRPRTRRH
jgi:hypothetical protein